jgi:hypothetical protein
VQDQTENGKREKRKEKKEEAYHRKVLYRGYKGSLPGFFLGPANYLRYAVQEVIIILDTL